MPRVLPKEPRRRFRNARHVKELNEVSGGWLAAFRLNLGRPETRSQAERSATDTLALGGNTSRPVDGPATRHDVALLF